jgi:hypothetical protein
MELQLITAPGCCLARISILACWAIYATYATYASEPERTGPRSGANNNICKLVGRRLDGRSVTLGALVGLIWAMPLTHCGLQWSVALLAIALHAQWNCSRRHGNASSSTTPKYAGSIIRVVQELLQMHCGVWLGELIGQALVLTLQLDSASSIELHWPLLRLLGATALAVGHQLWQGSTARSSPTVRLHAAHNLSRVWVVGRSGSGKSTAAEQLSLKLGVVWVDLDELGWLPGWKSRSRADLANALEAALSGHDSWVVSGNYTKACGPVLARDVTTVVWLQLPHFLRLRQLVWRTFVTRWLLGGRCCNGNKESLLTTLFSKDSILYWALYGEHGSEVRLAKVLNETLNVDAETVVLRSRAEVEAFIEDIR